MTPALYLVGALVATFSVGTFLFVLLTAPRHKAERRTRTNEFGGEP